MINCKDIKISSIKAFTLMLKEKENIEKTAAIIISSYDGILKEEFNNIKIIKLVFEDTTAVNERSFNIELANKIHDFIDSVLNDYEQLYICCDSGESRSAAIAAATYMNLGFSDKSIWKNCKYHPNKLVYKVMCMEYGIKISGFKIKYYCWLNDTALKNKIKKARKYKK